MRRAAAETKAGRIEALGMLLICLCRSAELTLQTRAVSWLDGTLQTRNVADFKTGLLKIVTLNIGGAFLRILYSYLQSRLTWKWRFKLTDHAHSLYFKSKAYYFIGEGGGVGGDKMTDPDHRITSDLSQTAQTFSDCECVHVRLLYGRIVTTPCFPAHNWRALHCSALLAEKGWVLLVCTMQASATSFSAGPQASSTRTTCSSWCGRAHLVARAVQQVARGSHRGQRRLARPPPPPSPHLTVNHQSRSGAPVPARLSGLISIRDQ